MAGGNDIQARQTSSLIASFGGVEKLRKTILADFFRYTRTHARGRGSMEACAHTHDHTHTHTRARARAHMRARAEVWRHVHTRTTTRTHTHTRMHTCTHITHIIHARTHDAGRHLMGAVRIISTTQGAASTDGSRRHGTGVRGALLIN